MVFATNNAHKLAELRAIVGDSIKVLSLSDIGCRDEVDETAETLEGNALLKARHVSRKYGCECIADDTGLFVNALDGEPGVRSARYAGDGHNSHDNVCLLLERMKGKSNRAAHFSTIIAHVDKSGSEHLFEGRVDGVITEQPVGEGGFGYDCVFRPVESSLTFAQMPSDEKNAISHRGRATQAFAQWLEQNDR